MPFKKLESISTKAKNDGSTGREGSSSWLSLLSLRDQGFNLKKGEFRDALNLRYGWQVKNRSHQSKCGKAFSTDLIALRSFDLRY